MAGGRGERLHPLTEKTPKPLLNVGGKPILETVIDGFASQGFKKFWLCVNYKAHLIEDYFGNGEGRGIKIKYTHEKERMGTAGALSLLPEFDVPVIVHNADVLTKMSYGYLMEHHARSNADATACLSLYQHQIPYGVPVVEEGRLNGVREKPIEDFPVLAGIYAVEPSVIAGIPRGYADMPDVLVGLSHVSAFAIEDYWCDVGRFEDLARANGGAL